MTQRTVASVILQFQPGGPAAGRQFPEELLPLLRVGPKSKRDRAPADDLFPPIAEQLQKRVIHVLEAAGLEAGEGDGDAAGMKRRRKLAFVGVTGDFRPPLGGEVRDGGHAVGRLAGGIPHRHQPDLDRDGRTVRAQQFGFEARGAVPVGRLNPGADLVAHRRDAEIENRAPDDFTASAAKHPREGLVAGDDPVGPGVAHGHPVGADAEDLGKVQSGDVRIAGEWGRVIGHGGV